MAAVHLSWRALDCVSEQAKSDETIVMAAVEQDWQALEYASQQMKNNEAVVAAVVQGWKSEGVKTTRVKDWVSGLRILAFLLR